MSKTVLITGVSSGIGRALAEKYLATEWSVFGLSRREPQELLEHPEFQFASLDLTREDLIGPTLNSLIADRRGFDLAILNAGQLGVTGDMKEWTLSSLRDVMEINVWSNKCVLDFLMDHFDSLGQVVTVSSGASVNGNRGFGGYSISKAALNMLTKLYAREFPETHFCALAPGIADTAMQEQISEKSTDNRFESFQALDEKRRTGQMPTAIELAEQLYDVIATLPTKVESGEFADIREDRFHGSNPRR